MRIGVPLSSRDLREPPDCGKQRRIRPFSRDSREFRDSRDSSSEKTHFVMTPFSGPDKRGKISYLQGDWESLNLLQGSFAPFGPKVANRVRK